MFRLRTLSHYRSVVIKLGTYNFQEDRIYKVNYKILEGIPPYGQNRQDVQRRYMCASLGLFYVKKSGHLVPIAIQLHQQPSDDNPIWTPNDSEWDWLCAKLWLRNSNAQFHQVSQTMGLLQNTVTRYKRHLAGWLDGYFC